MTVSTLDPRRLRRRTAAWQRALLALLVVAFALVQLSGSEAAEGDGPSVMGEWSAPQAWPIVAVHMSLLPTGQVLAFDAWDDAPNSEKLWDPESGLFVPVPYGRNLFCAGHIQLADGRTLIVGGNITANLGLADTTIFDASTQTYFRGPDMSEARWYPTATQLGDGRVFVFAGDDIVVRTGVAPPFRNSSIDSLPTIYDPDTNTWTDLPGGRLTTPYYPFLFLLPDGKLFNAGPDTISRTFDVATSSWTTVGTSPIDGMSAVMYRPGKIMKAGRWADPDFYGDLKYDAGPETAVIDMNASSPAWRSTAPMAFSRAYQNMTLLPDGTVLASGGMTTSDGTDLTKAVLPAEIWDPDTETWTTVDSLQHPRLYHSTALLLPDGRVLMGGGGQLGGRATDMKHAEIYSPPYLFKGPRPTITSAPAGAGWGASFDVTTPDASNITEVSLIRSPSVTHALDMNQRFQFLNFTVGAGKVTVEAPATANIAPPGDYLLYLLDDGVPSEGRFIRISASGDTTPPSAPSGLTAAPSPGEVELSWNAASDPAGISHYNVHRSTTAGFTPTAANRIAQPVATTYTDNVPAGTYHYKVTAEDNPGNTSAASNEATALVPGGPLPGLLGAWSFDEGAGATAGDRSGHGNHGTLTNATWSPLGKFGRAVSFDGASSFVSVPDSNSLDPLSGLTMSGWVRPTIGTGWRTLLVKERPGNIVWGLYSSTDRNQPETQVNQRSLYGTTAVPAGLWTHVAGTYDGTTQRLYVNGTEVAALPTTGAVATSTSPLKIGGNAIWSEWFSGLIDEVRVYDRALSPAELQADMNTPITPQDSVPPGAPGTLTATPALGAVTLGWGAASDNLGVARYNVHRSTTAGFTPDASNRIGQPTGTSYEDTGLTPGTTYYYRVTAEDGAGNVGPAGNQASAVPLADTTPPTNPTGLGAVAASGQVSLSWTASTDAAGIANYNVHRGTSAGFTPSAANRIGQPTGTSFTDGAVAGGATYWYRVTAQDPAGNVSGPSNETSANVPVGPPPGLVGAYGLDAGSGTAVADQSGNGNNGTLANATWAGPTAGRFGNALSFNGSNAVVTIPHTASLNLTGGATLSAWVRPTAVGGYRTVVLKERPGYYSAALYAGTDAGRPSGNVYTNVDHEVHGTAALPTNTWSHLAVTYNGSTVVFYVNGVQVGTATAGGSLAASTGAFKIGGNAIWGEYFSGLIDEVRLYNRALSAAEIQADLSVSITPSDQTPPSAPGTLTATGTVTNAQLSWGAATDEVGVVRYNVHRGTTPGFTPTTANRIAQPAGTSHTDAVAAGTYYYRVTAEDAVGNVGPPSNEAAATVGDTTAPSAPASLTATGAVGRATLAWDAATDDVGVAGYDVHRSTTAAFLPSAANRIGQPTGTGYVDTAAPGVYFYRVLARDAAGNVGAPSPEASATVTADTTPPGAVSGLAGTVTGSTVDLSWNSATDDVGVTRYNVHRGTAPGFTPTAANRIAQPTGTSHPDTGLAAGTYYYVVTAEDAAGNVGAPSAELARTVADGTPPSAPGSLAATAGAGSVALTWNAATDNVGVARYNVHRGTSAGFTPTAANRIAQPTGTSHADNGLAPGTYHYKVTAEDAAGNVGPVSNTASATVLDTSAPTAPTGLAANGGAGLANLSWTAATDNVGVVRYNVHRSTTSGFTPTTANRIAQPTGTSHTDSGLAAGTYHYKVTAEDAAGNVSPASAQATAEVSAPATVGLVAAYGLDAGTGTTATDQSGNGNNGTITNATWAGGSAGRFGNALSFNGSNASVSIPHSASLNLTTALTIEAWVRPTTLSSYDTVVLKERSGYYAHALYANTDAARPAGNVFTNVDHEAQGPAQLQVNTWSHLAVTYDGAVVALYVNGAQVATALGTGTIIASTGPLKIGGNAIWGEWFHGLIDEVRVWNRARTAAEVQADMNTSITSPDFAPPGAPGTLSATGGLGQVSLAWGAASDDVGVVRYHVHRSTTPGFTPSAGNRVAQPTGTSHTDSGLAPGTYYYRVAAEDAAGNVGPAGNEASAAAAADTTPPTVSITAPAAAATVAGTVTISANASDNAAVAGVQFRVDGIAVGAEDTSAPYAVAWDTYASGNGPHSITAVARDGVGNTTTSAAVAVEVLNTAPQGLNGAWALDESSGTAIADQSGKGNAGTVANGSWSTAGKVNNALSLNGSSTMATVPDSATLDLTTGLTVEAWLRPTVNGGWRTAVVKEQPGNLVYGLYASNASNVPAAEVHVGGSIRAIGGTAPLPTLTWSHLAMTYDGATLRLFVNGTQVAQLAAAGSITTSSSPLRIGANAIWGEHFNGLIDEVRVYNRALSAAEIQTDMTRSITPDVTPPTVTGRTPAPGAAGVNVGTTVTATFNELMNAGTLTPSTFTVRDSGGTQVPATVAYDPAGSRATLTLGTALAYGGTYTATVKGGASGVKDVSGNALAADVSWTFATEASAPSVLVVASTANPFGMYLGEILLNEGLNAYTTIDVSFVSPSLLNQFDVVLLGETALSAAQASALSGWVNAGGKLVAMRPDPQLASLLGITPAGAPLTNAYLRVDTSAEPGAGIVGETIQFHGAANRYSLSGATAVATLYTNATTATSNPAVTLRSVGTSGGRAAAFSYDLARAVVYARQGNPAWAAQERDGASGIRPSDLFYGARPGDVQPDWVDTSKIAIPQADEQQRLLLNVLTVMTRAELPLPRFWYLPRGEKAAIVMSGDDHAPTAAPGGTASHFERFKALSPAGCSVVDWECVRSTSYVYAANPLTNAQAASYVAQGFEIALHPLIASCPTGTMTAADLAAVYDTQLSAFRAKYTGVPSPSSSRSHCVYWPDWVTNAKVELAQGIRLDGNYYHYPGAWIGTRHGFLNGGGFPMRFADLDGSTIDVYQQHTAMNDEAAQAYPATVDALLSKALGPEGYYGAFGVNMHTDNAAPHLGAEDIVEAAQARDVPVISYKQLLDWVDGRNASTIRALAFAGDTLTFTVTAHSSARGLRLLLPAQGPTGALSALHRDGAPVAYALETIKGQQYATFPAASATFTARYG